jgi:hypothetical protein
MQWFKFISKHWGGCRFDENQKGGITSKKLGNIGVEGFLFLLKSDVQNFSAYFLHDSLQKIMFKILISGLKLQTHYTLQISGRIL